MVESIPVSTAAPPHGYGLRSREGGQLERADRPRGLGEVRSPDPRTPIRPPLVCEAEGVTEKRVVTQSQPGQVEPGTGTAPRGLPGNTTVEARPKEMAQGNADTEPVRSTLAATHDPHQTSTFSCCNQTSTSSQKYAVWCNKP